MSIRVRFRLFSGIAVVALIAAGCGQSGPSHEAPSAAAPLASEGASRCLLSDSEARAVFPAAKAGVPDRQREELGLPGCQWEVGDGGFGVHYWTVTEGTVDSEIRGWAQGYIDPLNPAAGNNVRFETIGGVGDGAMAFAETTDRPRGILASASVLVAQRGNKMLKVEIAGVPNGDRAAALQALTTLGRAAVARL